MNPEAIQRVAQNLPNSMMQALSAVASQTPHYPHTPGGGYGANYLNTVSFSSNCLSKASYFCVFSLILLADKPHT